MRRKLWLLLGAALLAVAAQTAYWYWAEQQLREGFGSWLSARRAAGWTATAGSIVRGGWPLAATLVVHDLSLEGGEPDIPGGLSWGSEQVVLRLALFSPRKLTLVFEGKQHLRLSVWPDVPFTADHLQAELPLTPALPPQRTADILANNLRAGIPAGRDLARGLSIGLLQAHLAVDRGAGRDQPVLAVSANAESIGLPRDFAWAFGDRISSLSVQGSFNGPLSSTPDLAERANAWREAGGSLAIERLALGWGPLGLSASATVALDPQLQPMGTATARVLGYSEALDSLAAQNVITRRTATAAKAVLALIARTPEGGQTPEVEVPLTLQDRVLSMRQIPLARIPPLVWPGGG